MLNLKLILSIICSIHVLLIPGKDACKVILKNGTVNGWIARTLNPNKKLCVYLAIPYASPPVGNLRFKPPEPSKAWNTINGTSPPNWCPQAGSPPAGIQMSEDCLFLNVHQPRDTPKYTQGLPVMVWFHGGAFVSGNSYDYNPARIQSRGDIIMVSVHYRIGLLGFLSTGDSVVAGNQGMKDQALALRWINENIQAFGGNLNQVTVFGESAGAASVIYQLISPLTKGLIHGVIAQSGTALSFWALNQDPKGQAIAAAIRLGCPIDSSQAILRCLQKVPWQKIVGAQSSLLCSTTPVVEPNLPGAFITETPEAILKNGNIPNVPIILGATKHDGSFILSTMYSVHVAPHKLDNNAEYLKENLVPDLLKYFKVLEFPAGSRAVASSLEMTYFSPGVNRSNWNEIMPGLVDLATVFSFKSSIQNTAEILSRRNRNVYLYSFEHHSKNTLWSLHAGNNVPVQGGIAHADDLMYIFNVPSAKFSAQDESFAEIFCDMWLNFVKYGNPTPAPDTRYENWTPYNVINEPFMKLNATPKVHYGYRNSWRPNGFEWN